MGNHTDDFIGIDVAKSRNAIALADNERGGEVRYLGEVDASPDTMRRVVEVQHHTHEVRIFEEGQLIAQHPVIEGKNRRRVEPGHRKAQAAKAAQLLPTTSDKPVGQRPLTFYGAVGDRLAALNATGAA